MGAKIKTKISVLRMLGSLKGSVGMIGSSGMMEDTVAKSLVVFVQWIVSGVNLLLENALQHAEMEQELTSGKS